MKSKVFERILASCMTLFAAVSMGHSQVNPTWATAYTGNYPYSYQQSDLAVDGLGNIYVSGSFQDTSWSNIGSILLKYNSGGGLEWVQTYDSLSYDVRVAVDDSNYIYITGQKIYNGDSIVTIKYSPTGDLIWKRVFGTYIYWNRPYDILTDDLNYVYVSGVTDYNKFVTIKYDWSGNLIWAAQDSFALGGSKTAITLDNNYNVYLTCRTGDTSFISTIYKYNSSGIKQWQRDYVGPYDPGCASGLDIKADTLGNIFAYSHVIICGGGQGGTAVMKYDTAGNFYWDTLIVNTAPNWYYKSGIDIDNLGNVYAIGNLYAGSGYDDAYITVKIDPSGHQEWVRTYTLGGGNWDIPNAIQLDEDGFIYVTGRSSELSGKSNFLTIKYDSNGNEIWTGRYHHTMFSSDEAHSLEINNLGDILVSGVSYDNNSSSLVTLKYSYSIGIEQFDQENNTSAFPNPFSSSFVIETANEIEDATLDIFDITGKLVLNIQGLNGISWTIQRNNLSSGMYFYTLTKKNKIVGNGKLIAE